MFKQLNEPYPFSEKSIWLIILQSLIEGIFVATFLILFEPFGLAEISIKNKFTYLILYGIVTWIASFILKSLILLRFSKYQAQAKWTVGNQIISIFLLIILITLGNYVLSIILFKIPTTISAFINMLLMVIVVGVFPIVFGVMASYLYHYKKYSKAVEIMPVSDQVELGRNSKLKISAENEKHFIEIYPQDFLFIESADNYSTLYFQQNGILNKELIRSSLTRLENQINEKQIVRCHRSFLVNLQKVQKVTGNAQGYKLHLEQFDLAVPVARKYSFLVENLKVNH